MNLRCIQCLANEYIIKRESPPSDSTIRMASEIDRFIKSGRIQKEDLDALVREGLDAEAVKLWRDADEAAEKLLEKVDLTCQKKFIEEEVRKELEKFIGYEELFENNVDSQQERTLLDFQRERTLAVFKERQKALKEKNKNRRESLKTSK